MAGIIELTQDMTEAEERGTQNSNNSALWVGRAHLNDQGKVIEDPASYGQAGGGATLPSTLPAGPVIPQLNGGALQVMTLPAKGTLLMVGDNNTLVAATEKIVNLTGTNFSNYGGTYPASAAVQVANCVKLRGMMSANASSASAGTEIASIPDSSLWPKTSTPRFIINGVNGATPVLVSVDVTTAGKIILQSAMTGSPWINLYGIEYNI